MHVPLLVLALSSSVSAVSLKGVAPQNVALYEKPIAGSSPARWKCLNSSQEIPHSAVNDNYCDCDDGTDEPGIYHLLNALLVPYSRLVVFQVLVLVRLGNIIVPTRVTSVPTFALHASMMVFVNQNAVMAQMKLLVSARTYATSLAKSTDEPTKLNASFVKLGQRFDQHILHMLRK